MKNHNLVYKITNNLNGKYYIGIHSTNNINDGYMGSGNLIKIAIAKDGKRNFKKAILHDFDTRVEALATEKELVGDAQVNDPKCYNLAIGGNSPINVNTTSNRYNNKYKYVFTSNEDSLMEYKRQIAFMPDNIYRKISGLAIDHHAGTCDVITDQFNRKDTNKDARSLLNMYNKKNLLDHFIITKELWQTN